MRCTSKDYGPLGVLEYALAVRMRVKRNATPTPRGAGFAGVDYGAMAKRCPEDGAGGRSKHRKTGIDPKWTSDFPWMIVSDGEGEGMMCALCRKHNRRPRKVPVGKAVWVDLPCKNITRQSLVNHSRSASHQLAVSMEADLRSSRKDGGIEMALKRVVSAERKAFIGALKCMYFLTKREIAHSTNFGPLLELAKSLGVAYLQDLQLGGNAQYTSERFIQEVVQALGDAIADPIISSIQQSPFFSVCIDETTDVSVTKELIVYIRYICDGGVKSSFLKVLELPNGTAGTITDSVCGLFRDLGFEVGRCCGLGSDGASVMLGSRSGVSKRLKDQVPFLVANHCIAHRLALAAGQSANEIPYLKRFKDILDQLYRFYEYSAVRTAGLKEIQDILNDPQMKLTQAKDVRWLSHDKAVHNLRRCFPSVITSLEREAEERNNAEAVGLAKFVKTYNFVAALYMLSDVLPSLAGLSRAFQKHDIDFTVVRPLVIGTKAAIDALYETPGEHFSSLPAVLPTLEEFGVQQSTDRLAHDFKQNVYCKYLATLSRHITDRFPDLSLLDGFSIFNPKIIPQELSLQPSHNTDKLQLLIDHYGPHSVIDSEITKTEFQTFNSVVAANPDLKQLNMRDLMHHVVKTPEFSAMFPNLFKLAAIGLLLPVTTVDCERGFSTLSRVKTKLRNRLSNKTLNHLLMISIEGPHPTEFPYDVACDTWAQMKQRRINVTE